MGTGGIRLGAGRPLERRTVESSLNLDIRSIRKAGGLNPGVKWTTTWTRDSEVIGSIGVTLHAGYLVADYQANKVPIAQYIDITTTPCHFGGVRHWLVCPRCGKRQTSLYFGRHRFACRTCNNLAYQSQQLDIIDRSWRKQSKIEAKMGGEDAWRKPKGMHESTWQRLQAQRSECEDMRLLGLYRLIQAMER